MGSSTETLEYLVAGGVALLVSALASSTSAALAALGEHRAEAILEAKERKPPAGLGRFVSRPDAVRLALLVLDSLAKAAFGMAAALAALSWAASRSGGVLSLQFVLPSLAVAFAVGVVLLLLVLTTARAAACRNPEKSLAWAAPVGGAMEAALRPLVAPLGGLSRLIRGPGAHSQSGTTEQLEYLIEKGAEAGVLDEDERDLLESVIEFSHVRVREIMVPRPKVVALSADASYDEVVRVVVESGHSRVPVYEDSVDNVIGVLYAKRLLEDLGKAEANGKAKFRVASWVNPPFFVPETMKISHLLTDFQRRGLQLAVVVDEFGGTSGVVTLEDVVEEIVGDIRDEDDEEEQPIRVLADGGFLAEGHVSIRDAEEFLDEALPDETGFEFPEDGDYDTLGGFITAMAGRVPEAGEEVRFGGMVFTVREADEKRVLKVELGLESEPSAEVQPITVAAPAAVAPDGALVEAEVLPPE
ncbi:MAG TPA: hemolysin family protein, partial [Vulgatibacter sp.]